MKCKYYFKNNKEKLYSYKELIDEYQRIGPSDVSDIVFSKGESEIKQDLIASKIQQLKIEGFTKDNSSYRDGEPVISDNESVSTQEFIDTPNFASVAKSYLMMDDNEYIKFITDSLRSQGKTEEEANILANKELNKWNTIGEHAKILHNILINFDFRQGRDDFKESLERTPFELVAYQIFDSLKHFKEKTFGEIKDRAGGIPSKIINNINLKAELENVDKTLFGHIDTIVIDGDGNLHLFNYKITTTAMSPHLVKLEKYRYQMALLKQILASHGFKVKGCTLNIVPIKLQYNEDYSTVESAIISDHPINFTQLDGKNISKKYDKVAQYFIKSTASVDRMTSDILEEANSELDLIFTTRDIKADGIRLTAKEWIKRNRSSILDSNNPEYSYIVEFGEGDVVGIKSSTKPENNLELIQEVEKRQSLLENETIDFDNFIKEVKVGLKKGNTFSGRQFPRTGIWLDTIFSKYFNKNKDKNPEWELLSNDIIDSTGLILLRNTKTKQLDVMSITDLDLSVKAKFRKFDYILGDHLNKSQLAQLGLINYKSTYGNIEAVKAMVILNKILPNIDGDFILGKLHIVSLNQTGQGLPFSIEQFNKECFSGILKYINKFPNTTIQNNFNNCSYINTFKVLLQEWESISSDIKISNSEKQEIIETGFGTLATADTIDAKINALYQVEQTLLESFPQLKNTANLRKLKNSPNLKNPAKLYELVLKSLQYFTVGEISSTEEKLNDKDKYAYVADRVPNRNFQIIVEQYTKAINAIAEQTGNKWASLRSVFEDFYNEIGYSRVQNSTLGGQALQFDDLYRKTKEGKKLLRLLNPYDIYDMSQIKNHRNTKQKFLKRILFEFAKIRYPMNGIKFDFTNEDDPALLIFINKHSDTYFNIPLEKASNSTRIQNLSFQKKISRYWDKLKLAFSDPKTFAEEQLNGELSEEQIRDRDISIEAMQIFNHFMTGESSKTRKNFIAEKGEDFFETNLERLLIHFIEADSQSKEYHKALVITKAVLLRLDMLGRNTNDKTVVEQTKKMIEDYIQINMFNKSIMDESSQKLLGTIAPLRRLVSDTLIGGNIIGGFRDSFEGVWQNLARTINKYQTNISSVSLTRAYATVVKNSFTDGRSINIVNQLCKIYRLSNTDVSRISEGLVTERGLTNMRDWLYASLRRPDFLNRMVLFVAQCYEDGVYDAFDIEDGKLKYDWKKDERFKVYASGNINNPKYYEQMGAYYNAIRDYNLDHPNTSLSYTDDLPMPYSFQEIESFKTLAKSIYGSYDKSTRAMMDHMAIGTTFGMFSTWMNGIYTNYMAKPGVYNSGQLQLVQATDEAGNLQFFDIYGNILVQIKDSNGNIKYYYDGTNEEATDIKNIQPVMDKVPIIIQGIWYTLKDCLTTLKQGLHENNIIEAFKENILLDPMQRKNLEKLFSDLLAWLFFGILYSYGLNPAYKEFKKGMKERDFMTNAGVELLYKSSSRSYDGFKGVFNVFEFLGENTNPPIYSQNMKLLKETCSVIFGNRSFTDALNGNIAIFKTFQDSWRAVNKT